MPKPKSLQVTIPNPCTQSWDEMTPEGQGMHCAYCQKMVTDFTSWTDTALYEFLKNNKGKKFCGKIQSTRLECDIIPNVNHSRKFYRFIAGLGCTIVLIGVIPDNTFAKAPYVYMSSFSTNEYYPTDDHKDSEGYVTITGKVVSKDKKYLSDADVYVVNKNLDELIKVKTDAKGLFKFELAKSKFSEPLFLQVASIWYNSFTTLITIKSADTPIEVILEPEFYLGDIIITH